MKNSRRLYGDARLIEEQLSQMQLMEEAAGGWAAVYKHKDSGAFWMKCYATAAAEGGGYLILIKLPLPTTAELIKLAVHSPYEDEAVAAVFRLLDEEKIEKKDFRLQLVETLERLPLPDLILEQQKCIERVITLSGLNEPDNKREVLHKSAAEVQQDAAYFKDIAERAQRLLAQLQ
ncbi:hypothetical protein DXT99_01130 [Pontibacter diazotrophicus]|uniref:Uncharacterized protein n=1 Tax=Pontibacter diazotrophicus TaxID=1400979 RepID=A0A3D8LIK4_9BACT|nr:hypothetical protein [Pontibacter diazotrophicus]RDV17146.1 hypothetical protein DXT99_01130 [Pontibacter diazotrophicus]